MGHLGMFKTMKLIQQSTTWTNMENDIRQYIQQCAYCAKRKVCKDEKRQQFLHVTAHHPFQKVMIDIAGPLPKSKYGQNFILGVIDIFSRYIMLIPLKDTSSKTIIDVLFKRWVAIFGAPEIIISDGGANLNSKVMKEFCRKFNVQKLTSSPYHPSSNGIIERSFRTVKDMLYATCHESGKDWVDAIPHVEIGLRSSLHRITGYSPYEIVFGSKMRLPHFKNIPMVSKSVSDFIQEITENKQLTHNILRSKLQTRDNFDNEFNVGDTVLVRKIRNVKENMMQARYFGPCTVAKVLGPKTYQLNYQGKMFTRNRDFIKWFSPRLTHGREKSIVTSIVSANTYPRSRQHERSVDLPMDQVNIQDENQVRYPRRIKRYVQHYGHT